MERAARQGRAPGIRRRPMIGDTRLLSDGRTEAVIEEKMITGYMHLTKEQEAERVKKGLPLQTYSYMAVRVNVQRRAKEGERV